MKKLLGIMLVVLGIVGCQSNDASKNKENNQLRVGMECDYAPYNWTTIESDKSEDAVKIDGSSSFCEGYDVMIASRLAKSLNKELVIKKISWDGLIPALNNNQIDAIIAGMSPTEERKQSIGFTDAYFKDEIDQTIILRKDSKYAKNTRRDQFKGAKITAQQGTLQVEMLKQLPGIVDTAKLPDYGSLMQALKSGTIDGYIAEMAVAQEHIKANDNFVMIKLDKDDAFELTDDLTTTAIGIRKTDEDLKNSLNEALAKISGDERLDLMKLAQSRVGK